MPKRTAKQASLDDSVEAWSDDRDVDEEQEISEEQPSSQEQNNDDQEMSDDTPDSPDEAASDQDTSANTEIPQPDDENDMSSNEPSSSHDEPDSHSHTSQEETTELDEAHAECCSAEKEESLEKEEPQEKDTNPRKKARKAPSAFLTDISFETLNLSPEVAQGLKDANIEFMSTIQARTIPLLLGGKDVLAKARTGSGKTLAFLVPILELLNTVHFTAQHGTGAVIIAPTRELAIQIFDVLKVVGRHTGRTKALLIGGASRRDEEEVLKAGAVVVVATPGRLLDHLTNTKGFRYRNLKFLCIDEADRILDIGFEEELKRILQRLPTTRQTMLFSATQSEKVESVANLSLKNPVFVNVEVGASDATSSKLQQGFVVVEPADRFRLLYTFLRRNKAKKSIIFCSSCNAVKFFADLLNYVDLPVMALHGHLKQERRTKVFQQFLAAQAATLLTTDVAARGLDIPEVDWIIQMDPPDSPKEYIHRVGRTARADREGHALLFLLPTEVHFLEYLLAEKIHLKQMEVKPNKIANIQAELLRLVAKNYYLHQEAVDAYKAFLMAYASRSIKKAFSVNALDLRAVAASFGLDAPPKVQLATMKVPKSQKQYLAKRPYVPNQRK